jgi:GNAT superfamily N-acetyltransferase
MGDAPMHDGSESAHSVTEISGREACVPIAGAVPSTYPSELETDRRILDGSAVHVRPIVPGDTTRLTAFHDALSPETQYRRFFSVHPHLSWSEALRFTNVDYLERLALIAEVAGRLVGVARYDRLLGTDSAEVAFVVADDWQHHGIATMLLAELAKAARARGVHRFMADTLADNALMIAVFSESGFGIHRQYSDGALHVWFDID